MQPTPIKLTLYTADGEVKQDYSCSLIPWGILKKAIAVTKAFDAENVDETNMDAIAQLVVDLFGNQFSLAELDAGADIGEMLAVLQAVVARAGLLVKANPTTAPTSKKK